MSFTNIELLFYDILLLILIIMLMSPNIRVSATVKRIMYNIYIVYMYYHSVDV